jgi:hypothetical protein
MAKEVFMVTAEDLNKHSKSIIQEALTEFEKKKQGNKLFYIAQVAKLLGKSHNTIKKLCERGLIKTTASGMITQAAIDEYLLNSK